MEPELPAAAGGHRRRVFSAGEKGAVETACVWNVKSAYICHVFRELWEPRHETPSWNERSNSISMAECGERQERSMVLHLLPRHPSEEPTQRGGEPASASLKYHQQPKETNNRNQVKTPLLFHPKLQAPRPRRASSWKQKGKNSKK